MKFIPTARNPIRGMLYAVLMLLTTLQYSCKGNQTAGNDNGSATNTANTNADDYKFDPTRPYPYETGILEYKYSGDYDGTEKVYFVDYGHTYRVEENYVNKAATTPDKVSVVFIRTPEKFTYFDNTTKKGYSVATNDTLGSAYEGNLLHDVMTYGVDSTMHKIGYRKSGSENVAGKDCQTYTSGDGKSKFCFWNGINIKTNMKLGEHFNYNLEATNIDKNATVDHDLFSVPDGITIMTYDNYVKSETRDKL
jgi:hypothetical protein